MTDSTSSPCELRALRNSTLGDGVFGVIEKCEAVAKLFLEDAPSEADVDAMSSIIMDVHRVWCADGAISLVDTLIQTGLATSKREAREFITGNSVAINGKKTTDTGLILTPPRYVIVRRGKRLAEAVYLEVSDDRIPQKAGSARSEGSHQPGEPTQEGHSGRNIQSGTLRETPPQSDASAGRNQIPPEQAGSPIPTKEREP